MGADEKGVNPLGASQLLACPRAPWWEPLLAGEWCSCPRSAHLERGQGKFPGRAAGAHR